MYTIIYRNSGSEQTPPLRTMPWWEIQSQNKHKAGNQKSKSSSSNDKSISHTHPQLEAGILTLAAEWEALRNEALSLLTIDPASQTDSEQPSCFRPEAEGITSHGTCVAVVVLHMDPGVFVFFCFLSSPPLFFFSFFFFNFFSFRTPLLICNQ